MSVPVIDPRNLDLVAAVLTTPSAYKIFDETKYVANEFRVIAQNYLKMRRILEEEDHKPSSE
jgi:hypothetical protein